jgi:gas vesicle protein
MSRIMNFILGATIGGIVGAALALIFTPSSGEVFRAQITDRTQSFAADIRQAASSKRIELQERLETLRNPQD